MLVRAGILGSMCWAAADADCKRRNECVYVGSASPMHSRCTLSCPTCKHPAQPCSPSCCRQRRAQIQPAACCVAATPPAASHQAHLLPARARQRLFLRCLQSGLLADTQGAEQAQPNAQQPRAISRRAQWRNAPSEAPAPPLVLASPLSLLASNSRSSSASQKRGSRVKATAIATLLSRARCSARCRSSSAAAEGHQVDLQCNCGAPLRSNYCHAVQSATTRHPGTKHAHTTARAGFQGRPALPDRPTATHRCSLGSSAQTAAASAGCRVLTAVLRLAYTAAPGRLCSHLTFWCCGQRDKGTRWMSSRGALLPGCMARNLSYGGWVLHGPSYDDNCMLPPTCRLHKALM